MLPSLSQAQCVDNTSVECSQPKAIEPGQNADAPVASDNSRSIGATKEEFTRIAPSQFDPSSRKNKRGSEHEYPRYETADPRDTVLSSEICVYSSATYTYTCRWSAPGTNRSFIFYKAEKWLHFFRFFLLKNSAFPPNHAQAPIDTVKLRIFPQFV